jgi:hypothetical protein
MRILIKDAPAALRAGVSVATPLLTVLLIDRPHWAMYAAARSSRGTAVAVILAAHRMTPKSKPAVGQRGDQAMITARTHGRFADQHPDRSIDRFTGSPTCQLAGWPCAPPLLPAPAPVAGTAGLASAPLRRLTV